MTNFELGYFFDILIFLIRIIFLRFTSRKLKMEIVIMY